MSIALLDTATLTTVVDGTPYIVEFEYAYHYEPAVLHRSPDESAFWIEDILSMQIDDDYESEVPRAEWEALYKEMDPDAFYDAAIGERV